MSERKNNNQDNFKTFIDTAKSLNIKGYLTNDAMVLTTDSQLLKNLIKMECENKHKIQLLNTNGLRIDKNSPLPQWIKNSIFITQPYVKEGYLSEEIGGNSTVIFAENKKRLQEFVKPIVDQHIEEFGISSYDGFVTFQSQTGIPPLEATITGENFTTKETFSTVLDLKNSVYVISGILNENNFQPQRLPTKSL